MTSESTISNAVSIIKRKIGEKSDNFNAGDFDPRKHKRRVGEAIAGLVMQAAAASKCRWPLNIKEQAFKELVSAGLRFEADAAEMCGAFLDINNALDIEALYESLIPIDFPIDGAQTTHANTSIAQKSQGSFYTPNNLAAGCVAVFLDSYIERNIGLKEFSRQQNASTDDIRAVTQLLNTTKIVDLSCGVGRFLVAIIGFIRAHLAGRLNVGERETLASNLSRNIFGYDVDPIALGIARLTILEAIETISEISNQHLLFANFQHANLLIPISTNNNGADHAVVRYLEGFIYDPILGRPADFESQSWDIVIGNPPWEKIRIEERTFFEHFLSGVVSANSKKLRTTEISDLASDYPHVHAYYRDMSHQINLVRRLIQTDKFFASSSHGELNTCALFAEIALKCLRAPNAMGGLLVKTSILTHFAHRKLFSAFQQKNSIIAIYDFINRSKYFPIDGRERFSWFMFGGENAYLKLAMYLTEAAEMSNISRTRLVERSILQLLNPETGMLPSFRSQDDLELMLKIYRGNSTFAIEFPAARFGRLVHLTMHANMIQKKSGTNLLPIYEGKFIGRYDGRFAGFRGVKEESRYSPKAGAVKISALEKADSKFQPEFRYFIAIADWKKLSSKYGEPWSLFWRSTTSSSNARTCIATILPHCPAIQSLQMLQLDCKAPRELALLLAIMNSKVFDFLVRNKLSGIDLTQNVIKQIAVPPRKSWRKNVTLNGITASIENHLISRVATLLAPDARLESFVESLASKPVSRSLHTDALDHEIDHLVGIAYGLKSEEINKIANGFIN